MVHTAAKSKDLQPGSHSAATSSLRAAALGFPIPPHTILSIPAKVTLSEFRLWRKTGWWGVLGFVLFCFVFNKQQFYFSQFWRDAGSLRPGCQHGWILEELLS